MTSAKDPLIVIDIQPSFLQDLGEDRRKYLTRVLRAVQKAKNEYRPVLCVYYEGQGVVQSTLRQLLKDYDLYSSVGKFIDDGSTNVIKALQKKGWGKRKSLILCGINLDCCVAETVAGLVTNGYKCKVLASATCNAYNGWYQPADGAWIARTYASSFTMHRMQVEEFRSVVRLV